MRYKVLMYICTVTFVRYISKPTFSSKRTQKASAGATLFSYKLSVDCELSVSIERSNMQNSSSPISKSQSSEHEFEENVDLSIKWNRWLLKPLGIWPYSSNNSLLDKYFNWFLNAVCYTLISFLFVPCGLYVILEVEDVYNKIKFCGPLSFCLMAYLKYHSIISHGDDIRECIQRIEWDWRNVKHFEDRNIMVENANFGKRLVKICAFFMYSGAVFYYIGIPIKVGKVEAEEDNVTFIPIVMPFPGQIIDTRYSPANEIFFSIQVLGGILIHGISAGACSLLAVFAVHTCGQIEVLMCWLGHLVDGRVDMSKTLDGRIASVVSQHVRILKYLSLLEKTSTQVSLVEVSGCTLGICLLGYYIITEWNSNDVTASVTYTVILVSYIFNIFIFCYIGEFVAELCRRIGDMSYMIEWHRLPGNRRLSLVLIIAMANGTIKLTAGNMIKLSLSSFSDIVKTSVAFLNMLRTLT
ncbi:odorant receptor 82a-like [Ptiloglossa arizonensis]|uniref:odorant receptor 82a-like n=1 Tax=Ptiloglossa arizonensis TaxID=3350558 RepID=UPI003F9FAE75